MKWKKILSLFLIVGIGYLVIRLQEISKISDIIKTNSVDLKIRQNDRTTAHIINDRLHPSSFVQVPELTHSVKPESLDIGTTLVADRWRNIFNSSLGELIYSAYRDGDYIRIIGAKRTSLKSSSAAQLCKIWHRLANKTVQVTHVPVHSSVLPDNHGKMFSPAVYTCPVPRQIEAFAVALAKTNDTSSFKQTILPVVSPAPSQGGKRNFSVCCPPLHNKYSKTKELVEWIELNKILGAQFFTFYNYSISKVIEPVLLYYSKRGLAEVLTWDMPIPVQKEIHYTGQMSAVNDCLYRNKHKTKYLAFFDLDEFIIPKRKHDFSWSEMLKRFPNASSYGFRNAFFPTNIKINSTADKLAKTHGLTVLSRLQRHVSILRMRDRSKCIVDPEKVETMGIHFVWKHNEGETHTADVETGLLHHYRWVGFKRDNLTTDGGVLKYQKDLIENVRNTLKNINPDNTV